MPFPLFRLLAGFFGLVGIEIVIETAHVIPLTFLRSEVYNDPGDCIFVRFLLGWPFIAVALWLVPLKDEKDFQNSNMWTIIVLVALVLVEYLTWLQLIPYLT